MRNWSQFNASLIQIALNATETGKRKLQKNYDFVQTWLSDEMQGTDKIRINWIYVNFSLIENLHDFLMQIKRFAYVLFDA